MKKILNYFDWEFFSEIFIVEIVYFFFIVMNTVMPFRYILGITQEIPDADLTVNGFLMVTNSIIIVAFLYMYFCSQSRNKFTKTIVIFFLILFLLNLTPLCRIVMFILYLSIPFAGIMNDTLLNTKILFVLIGIPNSFYSYYAQVDICDLRDIEQMITKLGFIRTMSEIKDNEKMNKSIHFYKENLSKHRYNKLEKTLSLFVEDIKEGFISIKESNIYMGQLKIEKVIVENVDDTLSKKYKEFIEKDN